MTQQDARQGYMMSNPQIYSDHNHSRIYATSAIRRRVGEVGAVLFDFDDTFAVYDRGFMQDLVFSTAKDLGCRMPDEDLREAAAQFHNLSGFGEQRTEILTEQLGLERGSFWRNYRDAFKAGLRPELVDFSDTAKILDFLYRNGIATGIISNTTPDIGENILDWFISQNEIDPMSLQLSYVFLRGTGIKKPSPEALEEFTERTGFPILPDLTAYVGDDQTDVEFAHNTSLVPIFLNHAQKLFDIALTERQRRLFLGSMAISDLSILKNFLERNRPNYRQRIALGHTVGMPRIIKPPSRDQFIVPYDKSTHLAISTSGTSEVLSHLPRIINSFENSYAGNVPSIFSINRGVIDDQLMLGNYGAFFHDTLGSIRLPDTGSLPEAFADYFTDSRIFRQSTGETYARGRNYYSHLLERNTPPQQTIDEQKDEFNVRILISRREISEALKVLSDSGRKNSPTPEEFLARLAVLDNLRGQIQKIYLSTINIFNQDTFSENDDLAELKDLNERLMTHYDSAVEMMYCHMLGLDYDEAECMERLRDIGKTFDMFMRLYSSDPRKYSFRLKSPEIENPLEIAMRANELCSQYPEADVLIGLASGGVELAHVSQLLFKKKYSKDIPVIDYPLSLHHNAGSHYGKAFERSCDVADEFCRIRLVNEKTTIICEDNSNSGRTIKEAASKALAAGAREIHFALIHIDPWRMIAQDAQTELDNKYNSRKMPHPTLANYFHPDFVGTIGVVPIELNDRGITKEVAKLVVKPAQI